MEKENLIVANVDISRMTVVNVPEEIHGKDELLDFLASSLNFPSYFGRKWDAFDEMLNDLDWLEKDHVMICHKCFPKLPEKDISIYLDILNQSAIFWRDDGNKRLIFSFG